MKFFNITNCGIVYFVIIMAMAATSCRAIRPYEKEYLLHPTMDDAEVERVSAPYARTMRPLERVGNLTGASGSTACPTCGG